MEYTWNFTSVFAYWNVLAIGLLGTVKLFIICTVLGLGGGLIMGMLRYSKSRWVSYPAMLYVEVFRNTPVLVQIIWFFFALPVLTGIEVSPFLAAILGITLNTIAFSSEVFRGGIQSIEREQWEAFRWMRMNDPALSGFTLKAFAREIERYNQQALTDRERQILEELVMFVEAMMPAQAFDA